MQTARDTVQTFAAELVTHGPSDNPTFEGLTLNGVNLFEGVDLTNAEVRKVIVNAMNVDWPGMVEGLREAA